MTIPPEVLQAFFTTDSAADVSVLTGGLLSASYSVTLHNGQKFVMQNMHDMLEEKKYQDYLAMYNHLTDLGWEIPEQLLTQDSESLFRGSDGSRWRAYKQLENGEADTTPDRFGDILGRLHKDLATLNYTPAVPSIVAAPENIAKALETALPNLPEDAKKLGQKLLNRYKESSGLPESHPQLIHGDPKTNNMLFRGGQPYTFIDWDATFDVGTVWSDIGDMVRSLAKEQFVRNGNVNFGYILDVAKGYHSVNDQGLDITAFNRACIESGQYYTLLLAMRYISDHKDGSEGYFDWDTTTYQTRLEHNVVRAQLGVDIYDDFTRFLESPPQIYVDFDRTLFNFEQFIPAFLAMLAQETGKSTEEIYKDSRTATKDKELGGYDYDIHIAQYGLDPAVMWPKLHTLLSSADFLYPSAVSFMENLRAAGYTPVILSYGVSSFQSAKIDPYFKQLSGSDANQTPYITTLEPKKNYINKHQVLAGGALVDDVPNQELPVGYTEVFLNAKSDLTAPQKIDAGYEVTTLDQAYDAVMEALGAQNS